MRSEDVVKFVVSIGVPVAAGIIGSLFTTSAIPDWYEGLLKPAYTPPEELFGPVWTFLFALMGFALFLVWKRGMRRASVRIALFAFGAQLLLNVLWSATFFGFQNPALAFLVIVFLWGAIAVSMVFFHRVSRTAAYLLIPYILWVTFAAYLNFGIWMLNV